GSRRTDRPVMAVGWAFAITTPPGACFRRSGSGPLRNEAWSGHSCCRAGTCAGCSAAIGAGARHANPDLRLALVTITAPGPVSPRASRVVRRDAAGTPQPGQDRGGRVGRVRAGRRRDQRTAGRYRGRPWGRAAGRGFPDGPAV